MLQGTLIMLITNIYVNNKLIDSILIHNTGTKDEVGHTIYELLDINNKRITDTLIYHKRSDGYRKLLINCLAIMDLEDIEYKPLHP